MISKKIDMNLRYYINACLYLGLLVLLPASGFAQMSSQFTQYMYNTSSINPAYAGSREVTSAFGLYRSQWVGIEGAPVTSNFALSAPMSDRIGMGLSFINDKIGPSTEDEISVDFSYNIPVFSNYRLYFGIKGTANLLNVDFSKLNIYDPSNPNFQNNIVNQFSPNVGVGLYLQSDNSYFGLSMPYMFQSKHYNAENTVVINKELPISAMAGYVFDLSYNFKFKPAILVSYIENHPLKVDFSANFLYNEKLTLGAAVRNQGAVSALFGFQITDHIFSGYSYDFETGPLQGANGGTHEIFLRFDFFRNTKSIASARFF